MIRIFAAATLALLCASPLRLKRRHLPLMAWIRCPIGRVSMQASTRGTVLGRRVPASIPRWTVLPFRANSRTSSNLVRAARSEVLISAITGKRGNVVAGIETDFNFADMKDTAAFYYPGDGFANGAIATSQEVKISSLGTLRGRLGWLVAPATLLYATGGLAYSQVKISATDAVEEGTPIIDFCGRGSMSSFCATKIRKALFRWLYNRRRTGDEIVGGNWSAKIEYLYFDLGSIKTQLHSQLQPNFTVLESDTSIHGDAVRMGLNYQFH